MAIARCSCDDILLLQLKLRASFGHSGRQDEECENELPAHLEGGPDLAPLLSPVMSRKIELHLMNLT